MPHAASTKAAAKTTAKKAPARKTSRPSGPPDAVQLLTADHREAVQAFIEKRKPVFTGK